MDNDFNPPFPFYNLRNRYPFRGERKILNLILENPNSMLRRKQGKGGKHSPSPSPFFHKRVSAGQGKIVGRTVAGPRTLLYLSNTKSRTEYIIGWNTVYACEG